MKQNSNKIRQCPNKMGKSGQPFRGQKITVAEDAPLLAFLRTQLSNRSATAIKDLLKHQCILVNDEVITQFDYLLKNGDVICVGSKVDVQFGLHHDKLQILYEDDFILVVNKASGLHSVDTTGKGVENACGILEKYIQKKSPGKRVYVVHRLDRDTSGVMLFAKSREAQNKLVANWNESVEERIYIAVVEGHVEPPKGTIDSYLYEDERKVVHSTADASKGLRAITHYETIRSNEQYTILRVSLDTGRTNQIRVHMQSIGHPVAGDGKYGAKTDPIGRLGLHAYNIKFKHPIFNKMMSFKVEAEFNAEFGLLFN